MGSMSFMHAKLVGVRPGPIYVRLFLVLVSSSWLDWTLESITINLKVDKGLGMLV